MFKTIFNWIIFVLSGKGEVCKEAVNEGLIDLSGQGRDSYGN